MHPSIYKPNFKILWEGGGFPLFGFLHVKLPASMSVFISQLIFGVFVAHFGTDGVLIELW